MLKKYLKVMIILLMSLCLLAGCNSNNSFEDEDEDTEEKIHATVGTNSPTIKTKEQILEDLKLRNESTERVYDEITINKRQTQEDKLLDIIFVTIKCHTDKIASVESYKITYGLYNEGWMLDTVELDWNYENTSRAISHPGTETLEILMDEYNNDANSSLRFHNSHTHRKYDTYEVVNTTFDEEDQTATTTIKAVVNRGFATITDTIVFEEWYDDGWCILNSVKDSITNSEIDYTPMIGKYMMYHFDESTGVTFEIEDLDLISQTISIKCKYYDFTRDGLVLVNWDGTYNFTIDPYYINSETGTYCNHYVNFECDIGDGWSMDIFQSNIQIYRTSNYKYTIAPENIIP